MSVEQRQFLGYARVASEVRPISLIPELQNYTFTTNVDSRESLYAFKIEWKAKYGNKE